jgi:hypothetical protein
VVRSAAELADEIVAHVMLTAPDLDPAMITALVQGAATKRRQLQQVVDHLMERPDAWTSGASDIPATLEPLLRLIAEVDPRIRPAECASCGRPRELRWLTPRGRICGNCYSRANAKTCSRCGRVGRVATREGGGAICHRCYRSDPARHEVCRVCGRPRVVVRRLADGGAVCNTCYQAPLHTCTVCGETRRAWAIRPNGPVCPRCYQQPTKECGACGRVRPIARRATIEHPDLCADCLPPAITTCISCGEQRPCYRGMTLGRPICSSCRAKKRKWDICGRCGRKERVQARLPLGPVCLSCYGWLRRNPAACASCGQTRPLIAADDAGRLICGPCGGDDRAWICADCGEFAGLHSEGRCVRCVVRGRARQRLTGPDGSVRHELSPLVDVLDDIDDPRPLLNWLAGVGGMLLGELVAHDGEITHEVLDRLRPRPAGEHLRALLVHAGILSLRDHDHLDRVDPWLDDFLAGRPSDEARMLRAYAAWFVLRRARQRARRQTPTAASAKYAHVLITTAAGFLAWIDAKGLTMATITQADVDQWLAEGRTTRRRVRNFLSWARAACLAGDVSAPWLGR